MSGGRAGSSSFSTSLVVGTGAATSASLVATAAAAFLSLFFLSHGQAEAGATTQRRTATRPARWKARIYC